MTALLMVAKSQVCVTKQRNWAQSTHALCSLLLLIAESDTDSEDDTG